MHDSIVKKLQLQLPIEFLHKTGVVYCVQCGTGVVFCFCVKPAEIIDTNLEMFPYQLEISSLKYWANMRASLIQFKWADFKPNLRNPSARRNA